MRSLRTTTWWQPTKLVVLSLLAMGAVGFIAVVVVTDVRVSQALDRRGITVQGHLRETYCGKGCSSLPVEFTTREGKQVRTDLPAAGDADDDTVMLRYDPQHPTHVQPTNGVLAPLLTEVGMALLVLGFLVSGVLSTLGGLPYGGGFVVRTSHDDVAEPTSHVRVVREP